MRGCQLIAEILIWRKPIAVCCLQTGWPTAESPKRRNSRCMPANCTPVASPLRVLAWVRALTNICSRLWPIRAAGSSTTLASRVKFQSSLPKSYPNSPACSAPGGDQSQLAGRSGSPGSRRMESGTKRLKHLHLSRRSLLRAGVGVLPQTECPDRGCPGKDYPESGSILSGS